jgi:hypothetical protein
MSTVGYFGNINKCPSLLNPCILILIFKESFSRFPFEKCLFGLKFFESLITYLLIQLLLTEFNLPRHDPRPSRPQIMMPSIRQPIFHKTHSFLQFVPLSEPESILLEGRSNPLHVISGLVPLVGPTCLLDLILIVQFLRRVEQVVAEHLLFWALNVRLARFKLFFITN